MLEQEYFKVKTELMNRKLKNFAKDYGEFSTQPMPNEPASAPIRSSAVLNNNNVNISNSKISASDPELTDINSFIDVAYILTNNTSSKNTQLSKNKNILKSVGIPYEVCSVKDMSTESLQQSMLELLISSKGKGMKRIFFIKGSDMLNNKFKYIYNRQLQLIKDRKINCNLWVMGSTGEFNAKLMSEKELDYETYTTLYDDITSAKLVEQKAKSHWVQYGRNEGRVNNINLVNSRADNFILNGQSGIVIASPLFDCLIDMLSKSHKGNVFEELQKHHRSNGLDLSTVCSGYPDLAVPYIGAGIGKELLQNLQNAGKNCWYVNMYK